MSPTIGDVVNNTSPHFNNVLNAMTPLSDDVSQPCHRKDGHVIRHVASPTSTVQWRGSSRRLVADSVRCFIIEGSLKLERFQLLLWAWAAAMCGDATNWDENAYRESILKEREIQTRSVFRTAWAPTQNPNPDTLVVASSDGSIASYSIPSCISNLVSLSFTLLSASLVFDFPGILSSCPWLFFFFKFRNYALLVGYVLFYF